MPRARPEHPMATLERRLRALDLERLRPEPSRVALARARAERLIDELHLGPAWMFEVRRAQPHGSLSRGTALRGFQDIDVLVVLEEEALATRSGEPRSAADTIQRMARAIAERRAGLIAQERMGVRAQTHSVGVTFPGLDLRVDLVPALERGGVLNIPRRSDGEWIPTFPERARARVEATARRVPWVKIVVRLLKGWRRAREDELPLSSYAVETLVLDRAARRPAQLAGLVYGIFEELAAAHAGHRLALVGRDPCLPPVLLREPDTGANLADRLDAEDRRQLVYAAREAVERLSAVLHRLGERPRAAVDEELLELFVGEV